MIRFLLPYHKTILKLNIIFSFILSILSSSTIQTTAALADITKNEPPSFLHFLIWYFIVWLLTGGFFLSTFYFEVRRKNEYYFYYNLGISKIKLIMIAYSMHLILTLPLLLMLQYV